MLWTWHEDIQRHVEIWYCHPILPVVTLHELLIRQVRQRFAEAAEVPLWYWWLCAALSFVAFTVGGVWQIWSLWFWYLKVKVSDWTMFHHVSPFGAWCYLFRWRDPVKLSSIDCSIYFLHFSNIVDGGGCTFESKAKLLWNPGQATYSSWFFDAPRGWYRRIIYLYSFPWTFIFGVTVTSLLSKISLSLEYSGPRILFSTGTVCDLLLEVYTWNHWGQVAWFTCRWNHFQFLNNWSSDWTYHCRLLKLHRLGIQFDVQIYKSYQIIANLISTVLLWCLGGNIKHFMTIRVNRPWTTLSEKESEETEYEFWFPLTISG